MEGVILQHQRTGNNGSQQLMGSPLMSILNSAGFGRFNNQSIPTDDVRTVDWIHVISADQQHHHLSLSKRICLQSAWHRQRMNDATQTLIALLIKTSKKSPLMLVKFLNNALRHSSSNHP